MAVWRGLMPMILVLCLVAVSPGAAFAQEEGEKAAVVAADQGKTPAAEEPARKTPVKTAAESGADKTVVEPGDTPPDTGIKKNGDHAAGGGAGENGAAIVPAAPLAPTGAMPEIPGNDAVSFLKTLMALAFVLGLIFLATYLFKKLTGLGGSTLRHNAIPINLISNRSLGDKKFLALVEIQDSFFLIGITQTSINLISQLPLQLPEEPVDKGKGQAFETFFDKAREMLTLGKGKK